MTNRALTAWFVASASMLVTSVVYGTNCYKESTVACCLAAGQTPISQTCPDPPHEFCVDGIVADPTIDRAVPVGMYEAGRSTVLPNGSALCTIQPKVCIQGKCVDSGPPQSWSCYSDRPNPEAAICQGPTDD